MHLQRLPAGERVVRRYVEDRWIPDHRDLDAAVEDHELADDADVDNVPALAFYETLGFEALRYRLTVGVDER